MKIKERKKRDKFSRPCQRTKKVVEREGERDNNCFVPKGLERGVEKFEIGETIVIIMTTASTRILRKIMETLKRLVVTQTPVKGQQLTLEGRIHKK